MQKGIFFEHFYSESYLFKIIHSTCKDKSVETHLFCKNEKRETNLGNDVKKNKCEPMKGLIRSGSAIITGV